MAGLGEEVADHLQASGFGTVGTTIFIGKLPDDQEASVNIIAVLETGGIAPYEQMPLKQRTIQILVRNTVYATCLLNATNIRDNLHNRFWTNVKSGGSIFQLRSSALQEPTMIGQDSKNRYENSCNYLFLTR